MLHSRTCLYWFTPFFRPSDMLHFKNHYVAEEVKAFFCFDHYLNRVSTDDLQFLRSELRKMGVQPIWIEGRIEKAVPSVARVLKAERVIYSRPENFLEFETVLNNISRELELHSIAFGDNYSIHYPLCKEGDHTVSGRAI